MGEECSKSIPSPRISEAYRPRADSPGNSFSDMVVPHRGLGGRESRLPRRIAEQQQSNTGQRRISSSHLEKCNAAVDERSERWRVGEVEKD